MIRVGFGPPVYFLYYEKQGINFKKLGGCEMRQSQIISDILSLNTDINLEYRLSKKPKWLKKIIAKRQRKRVYNCIHTLETKPLSLYILHEFYNILFSTFPPLGKYRSCVKFTKDPDIATIVSANNDKGYYLMMINFTSAEDNSVNISYTYMLDGKAALQDRRKALADELLEEDEDVTIEDMSLAKTEAEKRRIMRNVCLKTIKEDLITFLKFRAAESERIYEI